jgi:radical SAM superfamily enzyme YgiQ (UPF0313 family)
MPINKTITLIQPPLLDSKTEVDIIQHEYWKVLGESVNRILEERGLANELTRAEKNFTGFIEPNIGLFYVAGALKRNNCPVRYCDFHLMDAEIRNKSNRPIEAADIEEFLKEIPKEEMKIVGISLLTVNYHWGVKIAGMIKKIAPGAMIVLGGVHASFEYEKILKKRTEIDIIVVGEGEQTMVELVDRLYNNNFNIYEISDIKGLAFRKDDEVVYTGKRSFIRDLDELAYPLYELLPQKYVENFVLRVLPSRGCVNRCAFCVPSSFFNTLRFRDPVKVVDEIEYYYKSFNSRMFMLGDLNFLNSYKNAKRFCEELVKRELKILWMCQSRVDLVDEEIAGLMYKAGCVMVCLGVESADQEILNSSNKNITLEKAVKACEIIKEAGLKLFTFWVFGLPGETHDSAHQTIKLLRHLVDRQLIDYTHLTVAVPYPGTDLYKDPAAYGIKIVADSFDEYWMGCDFLGAGLPVMETEELSRYEIYAYWHMALAVVSGNLIRQ